MNYEFKVHKCFWVYQNKTFADEARGRFLWSPQYTIAGRPHPGYECMREVREGDIVFHCVESAIVAISRAICDCYSAGIPSSAFKEWDREGWRVDSEYLILRTPWIITSGQKQDMYKIQPPNGPFLSNGRGKQQYLCNVNTPLFECLVERILRAQTSERARKEISDFLKYTPGVIGAGEISMKELHVIEDGCKVKATLLEYSKEATLTIEVEKNPNHKNWLGKKVGDVLKVPSANLSYRVEKIYREES